MLLIPKRLLPFRAHPPEIVRAHWWQIPRWGGTRRTRGPNIVDNTVTILSGATFQITNEAQVFVRKTVGSATTVTLPVNRVNGHTILIADDKGDAIVNNITVAGAGADTIDGAASQTINVNYGALTMVWNGTEWNVQASKSVSSNTAGAEIVAWTQAQVAAPSAGSFTIFIANRAYQVSSISEVHSTASSSGTVDVRKDTGTQAPGAGTTLMTGTISNAGTANTVINGTLVATQATLQLAAGNRLSLTFGGTLTNLAGEVISIGLTPQ